MTQRLFTTVSIQGRKDCTVLLELPGDLPIREWIGDMVRTASWENHAGTPTEGFRLETEEGKALDPGQTLNDAGITSADRLYLSVHSPPVSPPVPGISSGAGREGEDKNVDGSSSGLSLREIDRRTRLAGPGGLIFLIGEPPLTVGRAGKHSAPDINLSEWDTGVVASRKHAVLHQDESGFALIPEQTTNGTFLNGVEIPVGESRPLQDGDCIRFGFGGLELIFRTGEVEFRTGTASINV
jgi:hypothetical protein